MTFLTGKHMDRRTLLKGMGAAIGLPLLDAMRPALAGPASAKAVNRLAIVYVPNGIVMKDWTPATTGTDFAFTRILKPLEPFRKDIVLVSGLTNTAAQKVVGGGDHAKATGSFLSGAPPKRTVGADVRSGVTFDQITARTLGTGTRVPSLQMTCEDTRMVGNCDTGFSCAYTNSLSWKDTETPMPPEVNPRSVFERLFGTVDPSLDPETRARRALYRRSILDLTRENTRKVVADLGAADKRKVDEYLTSIRELEQRITSTEKENRDLVPPIDKPSGIPFQFAEYLKLMFDLQVIAFQSDLTRVTTLLVGREGSVRTYPEIGVSDPHHPLTHHRNNPDFIERVAKINCLHAELFSYFLERLKATPDGDGTLLDHSAVLYGSALSDGNSHAHYNLPLLVAGGATGRGGRHIQVAPKTPVTNLFVTLMDGVGVPAESFGDSTGRVELAG